MILAAVAAVGAIATLPKEADAAATATVTGCTDTPVVLDANEKPMLDLHNQTRGQQGPAEALRPPRPAEDRREALPGYDGQELLQPLHQGHGRDL